ncbi:NADH dehydrogenase [ubiquinone] flavoprotein 3, mitochondrial isoform X2 [Bufo gargarizans]|uniref:NADH dehydrogenase [ubiquinone] flavoprotein 3, mitochondrial isoform X2 n=1 Tax=Bufo gargarizans TaxID=30331 RepID=UPI001CF1B041|nr:NADH dehydrogenase [ubiquinone] flavoprotein 3, mitochondrial isoform X2 [Bufo gargarizans]
MAAALRSVGRMKVLLLPRICVTSVRMESGGKGSPPTGISKTLVSFPVKISNFQQATTGENRNEPLRPVKGLQQYVAGLDGQLDREMELRQEVSYSSGQSVDEMSHKQDNSSSSSSSDSSSDSEGEGEEPATDLHISKKESSEGHPGLPPATHKVPSSPGHTSREKKSPIPLDKMDQTRTAREDLQEFATVVTIEEQSLQTVSLPTKKILPGADKMEGPDRAVPTQGASSTAAADSEEAKIQSTSKELPAGAVETKILLTTTSKELPAGAVETKILLTTTSKELPPEAVEMPAPMSGKTQMLSTTTFEEPPTGIVEMPAPMSGKTQILLTTTSEEPPTRIVETPAPMSGKTQILSTTTSEELPVQKEAAELHESYSPPEPAPQEPFDNTKYQNLQHFHYTAFTFVDVDVELAKYRLPQPSSGRQSPRH